jgi:hypothetical protein
MDCETSFIIEGLEAVAEESGTDTGTVERPSWLPLFDEFAVCVSEVPE